MNPEAIVFDLWQTLVPLTDEVKNTAFTDTAAALGIAPAVLRPQWTSSRGRRETTDFAEYLAELREELGASWTEAAAAQAAQARKLNHGKGFAAIRDEVVATVRDLHENGFKIAVVSNCSSDVREMLAGSPLYPHLDAVILSAEAGVMKPDPRIFRRAAEALEVAPAACLYVGDGMDRELNGAEAVGMTAVLVDLGDGVDWPGLRVPSLPGIRALAGLPVAS